MNVLPHCHPAVAAVSAKPGTASPRAEPSDHAKPIVAKITAVLMLWIGLGFLLAMAAPRSSSTLATPDTTQPDAGPLHLL